MSEGNLINRLVETDETSILSELQRVMQDKRLAGAPQMSAFLGYIVKQTVAGEGDRIKAYTVGVDALGKPPTFDAQNDPSVRVLALRLRKTLAAIYESDAQPHAFIELKVGTYMPEFYKVTKAEALRDEMHTAQFSQEEHKATGADPYSARPSKEPAAGHSTSAGYATHGSGHNSPWSLLLFAFIIFAAGIWIGTSQNSGALKIMSSAQNALPHSTRDLTLSSGASDKDAYSLSSIPTLYVDFDSADHRSDQLQKVALLLGNSLARSDRLSVIGTFNRDSSLAEANPAYRLVISELASGAQATINAQIVREDTGETIISGELMLDVLRPEFTESEVSDIEHFASNIADVSGPIYNDFCTDGVNTASVLMCELSRASTADPA